jgi:calcium/calmodulin-dependent protein kinase I
MSSGSALKKALGFYRKDEASRHYKFGKTLGTGSFATVKEATCKEDGSKWAIKCISKASLSAEDEEALRVEVEILEQVDHPNIVKLKEIFDCPRTFYMAMEMMTGGELFGRIVEKEKYTEGEARSVVKRLTLALKYCHERGIVHRDLKPENLLYADTTDEAEIKIADFGLAKLLNADAMMHTACGTPGYVAPEILEGTAYDKAVDMWSMGVITYILLCGFPPFFDDNNAALFAAIKKGKYDYPSPFWDGVSPEARDLIDHLLVVAPSRRLTADEVLAHPWVTGGDDGADLGGARTELKKWNARRKLRVSVKAAAAIRAFKWAGEMHRRSPTSKAARKLMVAAMRAAAQKAGAMPADAKESKK